MYGGPRLPLRAFCVLTTALFAWQPLAARPADAANLEETMARIGDYVRQYYGRAQSLVVREMMTLQPVDRGMGMDGFARQLVHEMRFEWDPDGEDGKGSATIVRELLKASGPTFS